MGLAQPEQVVQITLTAYNKSLFEREGLPDPCELYKKGEWTWDTFKGISGAGYSETSTVTA